MKHTPTPWTSNAANVLEMRGELRSVVISVPGSSEKIARLPFTDLQPQSEQLANADFIVQACNAHEALVEALTRLDIELGHLLDPSNTNNRLSEAQRHALQYDHLQARAALKLAGAL